MILAVSCLLVVDDTIGWSQSRSPQRPLDPPVKGPVQDAYAGIAKEITESYRLAGDRVNGDPLARFMDTLARNSTVPEVRLAASHIVGLNVDSVKEVERAKQRRDEIIERAKSRLARARRGDFTHDETFEYYDSGAGRWVQQSRTIDDNFWAEHWSNIELYYAEKDTDGVIANRIDAVKHTRMHSSRARAWDELIPELPEQFSGPQSSSPLVTVRFTPVERNITPEVASQYRPQGYSELFQGRYVAKNISGRELHHVTFAVDLFHFSTLPRVTSRHVYYVTRWKNGEELELSNMLVRDPTRGGNQYHLPIFHRNGDANTLPNPELLEMAGVVRMVLTVWSNQAKQRATTIDLQQRIDKIAPALIEIAENTLRSPQFDFSAVKPSKVTSLNRRNQISTSIRSEREQIQSMEKRATLILGRYLLPLMLVLPANSPYAARAKELLASPSKALAKIQNQIPTELLQACAAGKTYRGAFSGVGNAGELGIIFTECLGDGRTIRAEIFNPKHPAQTRPLGGYLAKNRDGLQIIFLYALGVSSEWTAPAHDSNAIDPFRPNVLIFGFELSDGDLTGLCCTGNSLESYHSPPFGSMSYKLSPIESTDAQLKDAQKRVRLKSKWRVPKPGQPLIPK